MLVSLVMSSLWRTSSCLANRIYNKTPDRDWFYDLSLNRRAVTWMSNTGIQFELFVTGHRVFKQFTECKYSGPLGRRPGRVA